MAVTPHPSPEAPVAAGTDFLVPRFKELVQGDPDLMFAAAVYETGMALSQQLTSARDNLERVLERDTVWRETVAALFVSAAASALTLLATPQSILVGAGILVLAAAAHPLLIAKRIKACANAEIEPLPAWVKHIESGVFRKLRLTVGLTSLGLLGFALGIILILYSLSWPNQQASTLGLLAASFGAGMTLIVFVVPLFFTAVVLKYRTDNLVVSVNVTVRVVFCRSKRVKIFTGSLNPDFWTHPRILGALRKLKDRQADLTIWARSPASMDDAAARRRVEEDVLPKFAEAGVLEHVRFLRNSPVIQHFMLADGARCRIEEWHAPFWLRGDGSKCPANNLYLFNPLLAYQLNRIVKGLEGRSYETAGQGG